MEMLIKVMAAAIAGSVIGLVLKKNSPEMSLLLTISLAVFTLYLAFEVITGIVDFIKSLSDTAGISPAVLGVVLKTVGISVVTKLSSDICRDAGQASLASGVEFSGAVTAIYVALPLFKTVISMINSLI